jgi:hypothetical protein
MMNKKALQMIETIKQWHCPEHLKSDKEIDMFIAKVYNEAISDVESFIEEMIHSNPMHRYSLTALKTTMFPGMRIDNDTK